jgi:Zn-dependent protease
MAVLIMAITVHEFAHAFAADRLGDDLPRSQGRVSLFPTDHLDPVGTLMMAVTSWTGFGIGWGKPVQTNPSAFRNPRRDQGIVAVAGPLSNIAQATLFSLGIRLMVGLGSGSIGASSMWFEFLQTGLIVNLALAFFNLIPLKPLDGSWIMTAALPYPQARAYEIFMLKYGPIIFLLMVFVFRGVIGMLIGPPVMLMQRLLLWGI